ncbi:MAG TPA: Dabb family protein [Phycisphaerales bacterium]|nr:Dabb family protein [Phycisphaerales bacterium]HRQ74683.1 Dabb family protein [Phycisphaerales bacterium]
MIVRTLTSAAALLFLASCAQRYPVPGIQHVILFELLEPSEAHELAFDAFHLMQTPVQTVITGPRIDVHGSGADPRYDVGITLSFMTLEHYQTFVHHQAHNAFMDRWRARSKTVLVASYGPTCDPDPVEGDDDDGSSAR